MKDFYVTYRWGSKQRECYSLVSADNIKEAGAEVQRRIGQAYGFVQEFRPVYVNTVIGLQPQELEGNAS